MHTQPRRSGVPRLIALFGLMASVSTGVAQDKDLHGAAPMEKQTEHLDELAPSAAAALNAGWDAEAVQHSYPKDNAPNPQRIALGRKLYFETALSKDGTVACATCHDSTRSFTDRKPVSEGVGGQLGRRNAPTTMNAMLLHVQFWDGRSPTLEHQAGQPILNPIEMGLASEEDAVERLRAAGGYEKLFKDAYGRDINYGDIQRAIAAFERTLVFLDAPFDRYMAGDKNAISAEAIAGMALFNGKARCVTCHAISGSSPLGTDHRFHNIGVSAHNQDFEKLARKALENLEKDNSEQALDEMAIGTDLSELGRFVITRQYSDVGAFRTPQLRNIGITAPYMHDGSMQTLWDTIDHYNKGGEVNMYLDGGIEALALTEEEIDQLVAFLFTLTDVRLKELNQSEQARQADLAQTQRPFRDTELTQRTNFAFGPAASKGASE